MEWTWDSEHMQWTAETEHGVASVWYAHDGFMAEVAVDSGHEGLTEIFDTVEDAQAAAEAKLTEYAAA